jgi:Fe-S oxidoreductase
MHLCATYIIYHKLRSYILSLLENKYSNLILIHDLSTYYFNWYLGCKNTDNSDNRGTGTEEQAAKNYHYLTKKAKKPSKKEVIASCEAQSRFTKKSYTHIFTATQQNFPL